MNQALYHRFRYLHYLLTSRHQNGHGIHSPCAYQFIRKYLRPSRCYLAPEIETILSQYRKDKKKIFYTTPGEASHYTSKVSATVASISKHQGVHKKEANLLFRLARGWEPKCIVEIGTSVGLSTLCLAAGAPEAEVHTLEGSENKLNVAREKAHKVGLTNIHFHQGLFDTLLPQLAPSLTSIDMAFIDGNHAYEPTLHYFNLLLKQRSSKAIFILHDIHWSKHMEKAWEEIKQHPDVTMTFDLFRLGIVLFRKGLNNQHFTIRF
jgi:predicted O-methyltransferase YrrM